jgi:hypothetical protein
MEPIIVFVSMFLMIFGISYLYLTTRNKERLALIERDKDVSIFMKTNSGKTPAIWKIILITLGMLSIGIGLGVLTGSLLTMAGMEEDMAFPSAVFLTAGTALLLSYFLIRKMDRESL